VDEIVDVINDLIGKVPQNPDAEEKKKLRAAWVQEGFVKFATYLDGLIGDEWTVGDSMTVADLAIAGLFLGVAGGAWDHISGDIFDDFKNIKRIAETVGALDAVKPWLK
jgi:glutathione S-transferase